MPLVRVQTSITVDEETCSGLMAELSRVVADALGKPESYMMVVVQGGTPMLMGGGDDPAALVEVRSVGSISPEQAHQLAGGLSATIAKIGVDARRIYTNFTGVPGAMWGMGQSTFG